MKQSLQRSLLTPVFLGVFVFMTGCYTQVGTTRDEYTPRDDNQDRYASETNDTTNNDYDQGYADDRYDDDWAPGYRYGFEYYYPTLGFSFSTYDPWWRYGGWYYYDPFWCGTYYPALYAGWHYWWPPAFYSYPYYGGHFYGYGGRGGHGIARTIGNTRGGGVVRGGRGPTSVSSTGTGGVGNLPTGLRASTGTRTTPSGNTPRVSTGRRPTGSGSGVGRSGAGVRGGTSRGGSRGGAHSTQPRTYTPPRDNGGSRGGTGRSYSPPPSAPPAQSTPPSGGGRSSGGGGARGGRGR